MNNTQVDQQNVDPNLQTANFDQDLLVTKRVDENYNEPIIDQVLRIAVYDEFRAFESYSKIVQTFGNNPPFSNILEAEMRHFGALEQLLLTYNVEAPINDWAAKIVLPDTLLECCELGVVAELDNIAMYDNLLGYVGNNPDIQDVFYRLQAASFNNHLPAFRRCVQEQSAIMFNTQNGTPDMANMQMNNPDMMAGMEQFNELASKVASGQMSQEDVMKLLSSSNLSFVGGALVGAIGLSVFNQMTQDKGE